MNDPVTVALERRPHGRILLRGDALGRIGPHGLGRQILVLPALGALAHGGISGGRGHGSILAPDAYPQAPSNPHLRRIT